MRGPELPKRHDQPAGAPCPLREDDNRKGVFRLPWKANGDVEAFLSPRVVEHGVDGCHVLERTFLLEEGSSGNRGFGWFLRRRLSEGLRGRTPHKLKTVMITFGLLPENAGRACKLLEPSSRSPAVETPQIEATKTRGTTANVC